jgi:hypothetical protein
VATDIDDFTNSARRISKARILEDFGSARDTGTEIMHGTHFSRVCIGRDDRAAKGVGIAAAALP